MQSQICFLKLAAGMFAFLALGAALSAQADPPKATVAVFSEEDAQYAETITLYADGKYQQAETVKQSSLYGQKPIPSLSLPGDTLYALFVPKRDGAWRVLNKGGQPIVFKTLASLPKDAVIEVKGAMPFGVTWEHQSPYQSHGDRSFPASDFQPMPPAPAKK